MTEPSRLNATKRRLGLDPSFLETAKLGPDPAYEEIGKLFRACFSGKPRRLMKNQGQRMDCFTERSHFHVATIVQAVSQDVDTSPNEATFTLQRFCGRAKRRVAFRRTNPHSRHNDFAGERASRPPPAERSHFWVATILRTGERSGLPSRTKPLSCRNDFEGSQRKPPLPRTKPLSRRNDLAGSGHLETLNQANREKGLRRSDFTERTHSPAI